MLEVRKYEITNLKPVKLQCSDFTPKDFQRSKADIAPSLSPSGREGGCILGQRGILFGGLHVFGTEPWFADF